MADNFEISVDSASLEAKLKSLGQDVQDRILNTALREGAVVYQAAVSSAAPERVDSPTPGSTSLPPGALKSDVIIRKEPKVSVYEVMFGKLTRHVARWVDEGHRLVKGRKEIGTVPGRFFFRQAYETATSEAEQVIEASIRDQVARKWNE